MNLTASTTSTRPYRVLFAGTPDTAVPSLEALLKAGVNVVGVLTRPDAPVGRKRILTPSPVAQKAEEYGLPIIKADRFTGTDTQTHHDQIRAMAADVGVVVAYGALLPAETLELLPEGWINLHFSLLPAYRGAAPVQHAVINGEPLTGACVFQLDTGMDTGPVYTQLTRPIGPSETAGTILEDLSHSGAELLVNTVQSILQSTAKTTPQSGEASYAPKLHQTHGHIDPANQADEVRARINGTTPEPGAWSELDGEKPVRIKWLGASPVEDIDAIDGLNGSDFKPGALVVDKHAVYLVCADGPIQLSLVQPAGKKPMQAIDWGRGLAAGSRIRTRLTHPETFQEQP